MAMAAPAMQFTERPAYSLPILTSGEVARLTPFVPGRTLRFLRMFIETVEQEVVAPMVRQPTYVEAVELMERNLPLVFAVRRPALSMLFADAQKNPILMESLRSSIDHLPEEVWRTKPDLFSGGIGEILEDALVTLQRTNGAVLRLLGGGDAPSVSSLHDLAEFEGIATRVDLLWMTTIAAVQACDAPRWFAELVTGLRAEVHAHARHGNRLLFDLGHFWRPAPSPEAPLVPEEREVAVDTLLESFDARDCSAARAFLLERTEVFEVLQATLPEIIRHFGDAPRKLSFVPAERWNDRHLAVRIVVPDEAELAARRDAFEGHWWSDNAHRAFGGLVVAVRPS